MRFHFWLKLLKFSNRQMIFTTQFYFNYWTRDLNILFLKCLKYWMISVAWADRFTVFITVFKYSDSKQCVIIKYSKFHSLSNKLSLKILQFNDGNFFNAKHINIIYNWFKETRQTRHKEKIFNNTYIKVSCSCFNKAKSLKIIKGLKC